jgi:hypothetical protein
LTDPSLVWPIKCSLTGVIVASISENAAALPGGARPTAALQTSDQAMPAFRESLLVASKASSGPSSTTDGSGKAEHHQKSALDDAESPTRVSAAPLPIPSPLPVLPQQVVIAPQNPSLNALLNSSLNSSLNPLSSPALPLSSPALPLTSLALPPQGPVAPSDAQTLAAGQPVGDAGKDSTTAQPGVARSTDDPLLTPGTQTRGAKASAAALSQSATNLSPASPDPSIAANTVISVGQNPVPGEILSPAANAVATPSKNSNDRSVSGTAQKWIQGVVPHVIPANLWRADPVPVLHASTNESAPIVANAVAIRLPGTVHSVLAENGGNPLPNAALTANANGPWSASPIPHSVVTASTKEESAPESSPGSTDHAISSASAPDQGAFTTSPGVPSATTIQPVALPLPAGEFTITSAAGVSNSSPAAIAKASANGDDSGKDNTNDITAAKQSAHSVTSQAQTESQEASTSGDQSQDGTFAQGQSAAAVQMNLAGHPIAALDHQQNTGVASPPQTAPAFAGAAGHSAKTPDVPAGPSPAVPQPLPVINTAKLIQTIGQSEMRVGIRSNEFGNISISTSTTRDVISAQISLDHSELARTLAVHLPEMQARLGGNQALDVRIDMNGQAVGQGQGTSTGMSNGSAEGSREQQQPGGNAVSGSKDGFSEHLSAAAPAMASGDTRLDIRLDARLDITA